MTWVILIALVLVAVVVIANFKGKPAQRSKRGEQGRIALPYEQAKSLFSPAERSFLGTLDQAVGAEYRVFGKVRVADIAAIKTGLGPSARMGALNRIASKHFDFIVCRAGDLSVVCAVELNDRSHASRRAQARDALLEDVCRVIRLPLLIIPAKAAYSRSEVRAAFESAVGIQSEVPPAAELTREASPMVG